MVPKQLLAYLRKKENKRFLVVAHIHLEGDALGSELALARLLKRMGKKVTVVNEDRAPQEYNFLPDIDSICLEIKPIPYDVAIFVDCSDFFRIGKVSKIIQKDKPMINIDHHISNTYFGHINWVNPQASCASEMVYQLFKALRVKINKDDAVLLYTGIMVDTGSFKYATTSSLTHRVAADLLKQGLDVYGIQRSVNESMSFETVKSFAKIIVTLQKDKSGKCAWLQIKYSLFKNNPALAEQTDSVLNFARSIKGVEVALLFKEIQANKEVRVNLRSRGKVDVNTIASVFGGGGHKMASGCTLKGTLKETVAKVTAEVKKRIR